MLPQFHLQHFFASQKMYELRRSVQVLLFKKLLKSNMLVVIQTTKTYLYKQILHIQTSIEFHNEMHWRSN